MISAGGYEAVVTDAGGGLLTVQHQGRRLVAGAQPGEVITGGRGQVLVPWPNRLRDGAYSFEGRDLQLALSEPARGNASHGLVRWAPWTLEEHTPHSVSLVHRVMAQTGYPWTLDLHVLYDLSADGLVVTQTATNLSPEPAPCASGAHPYLSVGSTIEDLELRVPARTRLVADDRQLPVGTEPVSGDHDYTSPRRLGDAVLDDAYGDLVHEDGRC